MAPDARHTPNAAPSSKTLGGSTPVEVATFLVVRCETCKRDVLTARDLDDNGALTDVCLHCEQPVERDTPSAKWLDAAALADLGYFVDGFEKADDRHGGQGCRGGSCGIQQPDQ